MFWQKLDKNQTLQYTQTCAWLQGHVPDFKVGRTHEDNAVGNNPS